MNAIERYINDLVNGMESWRSTHCDFDEWSYNMLEYDPDLSFCERFMNRDEIESGLFRSLIDYWNLDWYRCPECYTIQESSECDDCGTECDKIDDIEEIADWIRDLYTISEVVDQYPGAAMIFLEKAFEAYWEYFSIAPVAEEIETALSEYYDIQDDPAALIGWLAWANHVCHVSGSIARDYAGLDEIYDQIDSVSNGIIEYFGQEEVDDFMESFN